MRVAKTVFAAMGGALFALAGQSAIAGPQCGPVGCAPDIYVEQVVQPRAETVVVSSSSPYDYLRSVEYRDAPAVNVERVYGQDYGVALSDAPSGFSQGCTPHSTMYCGQHQPSPLPQPMPRPQFTCPPAQCQPRPPVQVRPDPCAPVSSCVQIGAGPVPQPAAHNGVVFERVQNHPSMIGGMPVLDVLCAKSAPTPSPCSAPAPRPVAHPCAVNPCRPAPRPAVNPCAMNPCGPAPVATREVCINHPYSRNPEPRPVYCVEEPVYQPLPHPMPRPMPMPQPRPCMVPQPCGMPVNMPAPQPNPWGWS